MKKLLSTLFALCIIASAAAGNYKRSYSVGNFHGIDCRGIFDIVFTQSNKCDVRAESEQDILKNVTVKVKGGILIVDYSYGFKLIKKEHAKIKLYVTAPVLNSLDASGACSFTCQTLKQTSEMEMDLSGAVKLNMNLLECSNLEADCSGAAEIRINKVKCPGNIEMDFSGATKLMAALESNQKIEMEASGAVELQSTNMKANRIKMEASGAVKGDIKVDCKDLYAECSGASKLVISGTADTTKIENTGVAKIDTKGLNNF